MTRLNHDPTDPDSPHIEGIQPSFGNLPFACEILSLRASHPDVDWADLYSTVTKPVSNNKAEEATSLLRKLGCLTKPNTQITGTGATIAAITSASVTLNNIDTSIESKATLTADEQALLQSLIFEYDWLPMLAVLHQTTVETVPTTKGEARANSFINRLQHLENYDSEWQMGTKQTKTEIHYDWAEELDLIVAVGDKSHYELSSSGRTLSDQLSHLYHPDWDTPSSQSSLSSI